jgi:hypothetical protein
MPALIQFDPEQRQYEHHLQFAFALPDSLMFGVNVIWECQSRNKL